MKLHQLKFHRFLHERVIVLSLMALNTRVGNEYFRVPAYRLLEIGTHAEI